MTGCMYVDATLRLIRSIVVAGCGVARQVKGTQAGGLPRVGCELIIQISITDPWTRTNPKTRALAVKRSRLEGWETFEFDRAAVGQRG